ncbi:MAG: motility hub landmark protein FimV [Wenzhouxiangellaceae bacterium]
MNRHEWKWRKPLSMAIALALPGSVLALGLGEARVDSYLNQPLDVRMRILDAGPDELDSLTVSPASAADYARLGLMGSSLLPDLELTVDRSMDPPVIRVRSRRPVSEPVVQLLLDARWSGGRLLREYTLFLDPATIAVAPPPPVAPAVAEPARPEARTQVPEPMRRQSPDVLRPAAPRAQARQEGRYGPVRSGETLWSIARAARPADDISMDQMMIAIVELNPSAFRDRNINRLLRGAVLELPNAEQARAIDPETARAMVAEHNRAFRSGSRGDVPVISDAARVPDADEAPADAPRSTGVADADDQPVDYRVELVPPGESGEGAAGTGAEQREEVAALRQQLARTEEELYAARQEAEEFRARLAELEALVQSRSGALGLEDAELATLEQTLREARQAAADESGGTDRGAVSEELDRYLERLAQDETDAPAQGSDAPEMALDTMVSTDGGATPGEPSDVTGSDPALAAADSEASQGAAQPVPPASEPVTTQVQRKGVVDRLLALPVWIIGLLAALIAALVAGIVMTLRRGAEAKDGGEGLAPAAAAVTRREPVQDPVAAARANVAADPDDLQAHLGLLEALAGQGDEAAFATALEAMFTHVDSGTESEWREAVALAERVVPDHALVKGSADWVDESDASTAAPSEDEAQDDGVDELMSRFAVEDDHGDGDDRRADAEAVIGTGSSLGDGTEDLSEWLGDDSSPQDGQAGQREAGSEAESDEARDYVFDWPGHTDKAGPQGTERIHRPTEGEETGPQPVDADTTEDAGPQGTERMDRLADSELAGEASDDTEGPEQQAGGEDHVAVKLDLARAYISWNSTDSARTLLNEVLNEGNEEQQATARRLLDELDGAGS